MDKITIVMTLVRKSALLAGGKTLVITQLTQAAKGMAMIQTNLLGWLIPHRK